MAIVRAVKSGNWSDTTVWNTGALPTSADDVYSNTFTVTIDVSPTVLSIDNRATTGVTAGGGFTLSANGLTLTANVNNNSLTISPSVSSVVNIVGNITAVNGGPTFNGLGTLNFTGNITAGTLSNAYGLTVTSSGALNITGNVFATTSSVCYGLYVTGSPVISVVGNVLAAGGNAGILFQGSNSGQITVIGTVTPASSVGISGASYTGVARLTGPFLCSSQGVLAILLPAWRWVGASPSPSYLQIRSSDLSTIRPLYTADSVGGNPATSNVRSGTVYGPSNELTGTCAVPPAGSVALGVPVDNTTGTAAITAANIRSAVGLASANLDTQLAAIPTTAAPTAAAVASAVWAAATRTLTTTIPAASDIAAAVWSAVTRTITGGTVDTLTNAPSVPSAAAIASQVRSELSTELARIDATVSTRLASSSYTTPPTASAIATAVNSALDRTGFGLTSAERQAIATAVEQSILNENDGQAILNAIVGAIGNQNIDQVALVAAIRADLERTGGTLATRSTLTAAQVRTELAPELGNLDATISSRLPSSGYTAPPSAASIATSVWSAATRTLTTAFDSSATIAAAVWSAATRTLTSSSAPSAADNAAAVWGYSSGRTVTGGTVDTVTNSTPVDAGEIADAVRTELTPELARLSNAATTQEVGDIVEGALAD